MAIERIVDGIDLNNFGVLFHSIKSIEEFQKRSGMEGAYKTEYQHHFISLVARLKADGQVLDVAIPMAMYNYHQEVGGASVEFNIAEVTESSVAAMPKAIEKFNEFETTDMYKSLVDMGFSDWCLYNNNSIHAHPNGVNRFSGTDLRADIKHPGVNFPLSTGVDVPNFASIIQHVDGFAEIIHTEYRMFNGVANGERNYKKGRTLTVVKGVAPEPEVEYVEVEPGIIDTLFGTRRPQPPKPAAAKKRPSYWLDDGFANADKLVFQALKDELMEIWEECDFEIDVSNVLKTNVTKGRGRLQTRSEPTTWYGRNKPGKQKISEYNDGLFGDWGRTDGDDELILPEEIEPSHHQMKRYLTESGTFTWTDLTKMDVDAVKDAYWLERLDELEDDAAGILPDDVLVEDSVGIHFSIQEQVNMLVADNIVGKEKLSLLKDVQITELFNEVYNA